ncbi:hypothetical protein L198_02099 [Cryptococcus wingfieldii CBS 7118]|uniref:Uncharacterized protein n=1 Tax=Cryptococcus wingfieldii CBS 7118 TaxID=1295528 RepID=A0A1E3JXC3_9TREE|nr:hypothetical protein L198_02099 [Cryptococcus wingfieldii CBS 7118]ODO05406.1 hypothetical protein L198_02099 [Cryptococcus wingfieldii CBS 7118]
MPSSRSNTRTKTKPRPLSSLTRSTPLLLLLVLAKRATGQYIPPQAAGLRRAAGFGRDDSGERWVEGMGRDLEERDDGGDDTQSSTSRSLYLVSSSDFCLFGPPSTSSKISETGGNVVSWCTREQHGNRLIPDGTLRGVTYVKAPGWVQVSGTGDFTQINIAEGDYGGQFDSGDNTPDGAVLYTTDDNQAADSWITMISADTFCLRACSDPTYCPLGYDEMGCYFYTSNGVGWDGVYQDCAGDDGDPPGVVDGVTYTQGNDPTPTPSTPAVSNCNPGSSVANGQSATAAAAAASSDSSESGSSSDSSGDASESGGGSTSWVPVQTCVPCTDTASASGSEETGSGGASSAAGGASSGAESGESSAASSSAKSGSSASGSSGSSAAGSASGSGSEAGGENGGTQQVGITQLSGGSVAAVQISAASSVNASTYSGSLPSPSNSASESSGSSGGSSTITSAPASTGTSAAGGENGGDALGARGWLVKKDEETTTSDGKCCFTTWTPSVVGGAQETGAASSGGGSSSSKGNSSGSGSVVLSGAKTAGSSSTGVKDVSESSTSGSVRASGTLGSESSTASGNTSGNGTNDTSGALRLEITGIGSGMGMLLWTAGVVVMGTVVGGSMVL